jgi:phosphoribosylaminoimidazolecarboxamide formyltransferase/IMP cyclohydrolase
VRRIERALISVYDKTGIVEFARGLAAMNVEILSTGGTHKLLAASGIPVREVSDFTGFPEILDGRVKTINPRVAAGLLAMRESPEHMRQMAEQELPLIDLVCVNLYPFVETIRKPGVQFEEVIENIDIGGPSMIRAAAKNFQDVVVVTSPLDYSQILAGLAQGNGILDRASLFALAQKAFLCTARYDGQIAQHLSQLSEADSVASSADRVIFPPSLFMDFEKIGSLRYGENPHQLAAFYRVGGEKPHGIAGARQLQGKELSYNNIVDLEAAWNLIREFGEAACCVIKHTNPCGTAVAGSLRDAYLKAYAADSVSAFGSVIGFNKPVDGPTATEVAKLFVEAIVAPGFDAEATALLAAKKNLRLVVIDGTEEAGAAGGISGCEIKRVSGGILVQERDSLLFGAECRVVSARQPDEAQRRDLEFAWRVVKHVKSNAIVLAKDLQTVGVGAGQMSRVDAVKICIQKANPASKDAVLASDAYFPFRDGIDEAARGGVTAIIQPGGSMRDEEAIRAADEHGLSMIFTGLRHFKH